MKSPKIDWAEVKREAEEVLERFSKEEADCRRRKKRDLKLIEPFIDFLDSISEEKSSDGWALDFKMKEYASSNKLYIVLAPKDDHDTLFEQADNPSKIMHLALEVYFSEGTVSVYKAAPADDNACKDKEDFDVEDYVKISDGYTVNDAILGVINWITLLKPEIVVSFAKKQMAKPPQARL